MNKIARKAPKPAPPRASEPIAPPKKKHLNSRAWFYDLDRSEQVIIQAMLAHSSTGQHVFAGLNRIANYARLSRRHVQRILHGRPPQKRKGRPPKVQPIGKPGLIERGVIVVIEPANQREQKPAHYRINETALAQFGVHPRMAEYLHPPSRPNVHTLRTKGPHPQDQRSTKQLKPEQEKQTPEHGGEWFEPPIMPVAAKAPPSKEGPKPHPQQQDFDERDYRKLCAAEKVVSADRHADEFDGFGNRRFGVEPWSEQKYLAQVAFESGLLPQRICQLREIERGALGAHA